MAKPTCYSTTAFAASSASSALAATTIERRQPTASDVQIQILYCGVCHSDLHFARNEWHFTQYPAVPGHEIVGKVTAVGSGVKKFKVGDTVGVGCLVDSCRTCPDCRAGLEQFCNGMIMTYGSMDKYFNAMTLGGYAQSIVVTEDFVLRMPANLNPAAAGLYQLDGKQYGIPFNLGMVGVWYRKSLFEQAGIDGPPATWDEFLTDIQTLKAKGITPLAVGEKDKWPGMFWWANLSLRIAGQDAMAQAGQDGNFNQPGFVKAGEELKKLIDMKPFQDGHHGKAVQ